MARVLWTGFEMGDIEAETDAEAGNDGYMEVGEGGDTIGTFTFPVPRSGDYCVGTRSGITAGQLGVGVLVLPASLSELYFRFALYVPLFRGGVTEYPSFFTLLDGSSNPIIRLGYNPNTQRVVALRDGNSSSYLGFNNSGTLLATGSYVLQENEWTLFEGYLDRDAAAGTLQIRVRGVTDPLDIDFSGNTGAADIEVVRFGCEAGFTSIYLPGHFMDDIAVNDTAGSYQNSWPGAGGIYLLKPNGAGSQDAWSPSDAGVDNWTLVDEIPSDDDTTYVYDDVSGHQDLYNIESLAASVDRIWLIAPCFTGALATPGTANVMHLYRAAGTTYQKGTVTISSDSYSFFKDDPIYTDPGTAAYFTPAIIAAMETGVEVE